MKYLSLALACGLILSACGGTDDTPVPPRPGIEGLWQGTSVDNINDAAGSVPIESGEAYIVFENVTDNPVDATFYAKSASLNCLEKSADKITHIGSNRYKDSFGGIATVVPNGNALSMIISGDGMTLKMDLKKNTTLSKTDLQVCNVQSDPDNLILNDRAKTSFLQTILSKSRR